MKTMNDHNDLDPAVYAADLAKTIALEQSKLEFLPDWWQQVVAQLHSQLDKQFPPFYDDALDTIPPWKGGSAPDELPDFFRLPKMAPTRMNLLDWRQNGFEQRLGDLEARLPIATGNDSAELAEWDSDYCRLCGINKQATHAPWCEYRDGSPVAEIDRMRIFSDTVNDRFDEHLAIVEKRLAALEDWADIDFDWPNNKETSNCIHELIAAGMTGVTADMQKTIDRLTGRIDEIQDLLLKAVLKVDALETKTPC